MRQIHKIALLAGVIAIITVAVAVAVVVVVLNSGGELSATEKQIQIEHKLKVDLERQARQGVQIRRVTCVRGDASHYECLARAEIGSEVVSVPIAVTADDKRLLWRVEEPEEAATAGSENTRLPSAESLAWGQVTCGEVRRAVSERDNRWLARAGEAVATEAVGSRPNANAERLAEVGARNLILVCRKASNPGYKPMHAANTALLTGTKP